MSFIYIAYCELKQSVDKTVSRINLRLILYIGTLNNERVYNYVGVHSYKLINNSLQLIILKLKIMQKHLLIMIFMFYKYSCLQC